jgi:hypothetical protein
MRDMTDAKTIQPDLGESSFTCPHCGAIAHQTWFSLYLQRCDKDNPPRPLRDDALDVLARNKDLDSDSKNALKEYSSKRLTGLPFEDKKQHSAYLDYQLDNVWSSRCYSCDEYAVWIGERLVYPDKPYEVAPNLEMPDDVKVDFLEASKIVHISARGAAALLRLGIQKLVKYLGEKGDNLNEDIGKLVQQKKITPGIQQALDVVRVVGNHAVHPGTIDFNDNKTVASNLFELVNVIVESTIATPKHIQDIYRNIVPEEARKAIEKRDAPKLVEKANES